MVEGKIVLSENNYNRDFKIEKGIHPGKPESEIGNIQRRTCNGDAAKQ
jgi:hypothetical protein